MSDPDIKGRFTPHILDITQALTRLEDEAKPPAGTTTLHWEDPASPTGRTASPGWTETGTSGGSRILWKAADSGDLLITTASTEEIPDTKPPAGDIKLLLQIADAIHYTLYGSRGNDSTRKLATTAAHAVMSVRDLEVVELRRSLAISRKRTQHFAALYSEALDELEDIAP